MSDISGTWRSYYEYGGNASEHIIIFKKEGDVYIGISQPLPDGESVEIRLQADDTAFTGTFQEKTSSAGHYKGAVFHGALQFLLEGKRLHGQWVGFNSGRTKINNGPWTLQRIT